MSIIFGLTWDVNIKGLAAPQGENLSEQADQTKAEALIRLFGRIGSGIFDRLRCGSEA